MAVDSSSLVPKMLSAAAGVIGPKWSEAQDYAKSEFLKISQSILFIEEQLALDKMTREQAQLHLDLQKNASRAVLLTLEGLGILGAEAAINAALGAIKDVVNGALKFTLIA